MLSANTTIKEMGNLIAAVDRVLLFPHIHPDPDAIGSCMALCRSLRQQGKTAWILADRSLPAFIQFLLDDMPAIRDGSDSPADDPAGEMLTLDASVMDAPDLCIMVDCSEDKRIEGREKLFHSAGKTLCIDHHQVEEFPFDHYYIEPEAAATAQIVYQLIREMDWTVDQRIAEYLYTGICGDTGCFMHPNTTAQIHRIAADLQDLGVDANYFNVKLFQSKELKMVKVNVKALEAMEILADGRAVISKMSTEDFKAIGANVDHADTVIDNLRQINGVEIAAFLKQDGEEVRGNLRSKSDADVSAIAQKFGGGGHTKAAGFRIVQPLQEVYVNLQKEILRTLGESDDQ